MQEMTKQLEEEIGTLDEDQCLACKMLQKYSELLAHSEQKYAELLNADN